MDKQRPSEKCFDRNLELFAHVDPFYAQRVALVEPEKLFFCYTNDELNLQTKKDDHVEYFYSPEGAEQESKAHYETKNLTESAVVYQFGLGLGYDYLTLKKWLKEAEVRHLVFMEDDLEVVYYWLHTPLATEMLKDPQVTILCFQNYDEDRRRFYKLHCRFVAGNPIFTTLGYYARTRQDDCYLLAYNILSDKSTLRYWTSETLRGGGVFFESFYRNIFHLPESYSCNGLAGQFANVPAIICGAGPSLHKNIELLKTLTDRALIFAGGSSLNILNEYGIIPHFGAGVDPNPEQTHRLMSNHSFALPFIYSPRMKADALNYVHGDLLFAADASGYGILQLLDKQMGIVPRNVNAGHNVVNFCTSLAGMMGCNPLIFVGMDMAYTESEAYAKGHP